MLTWLFRLFGRTEAAPPVAQKTVAKIEAPPPAPGVGARRPLVNTAGHIAGFEFGLSDALEGRLRQRADPVVEAAHARLLLASMRRTLESGRVALLRVSLAALERPGVADAVLPGTLLLVGDAMDTATATLPALVTTLRQRGAKVGVVAPLLTGNPALDPVLPEWADFILLQADAAGASRLLPCAVRCRQQRPGAQLIATDIEDVGDLELLLKSGIALAAGAMRQTRLAAETQPLPLAVQRLARLLNGLLQEMETSEIATELRADLGLTYRLLRYVNSAAMGLKRQIASIEQAVVMLGRGELYRWLSVLLLNAGEARATSPALQEVALARARLLENLARLHGRDPPPALFTLGLLSMLDTLLQRPLAEVLAPLNLPAAAVLALLHQRGPWHVYLELAQRMEQHQPIAADMAALFGGLEPVLTAVEEAWSWAAEMARQGEA